MDGVRGRIVIMKDNNKPRKYFEGRAYNREYFNTIDAQDKAYILGFLWGDGSCIPGKRTVALTISTKDEAHLRKIATCLGLEESEVRRHVVRSFGNKKFSSSKIQMSHKIFFEAMERLGYGKKPQRMMRMPKLPDNMIRHFLRGLFDADGSVHCKRTGKFGNVRKGRMEVSLPHLPAVNWWSNYFQKTLGVPFQFGRDKSIYRVTLVKKSDLKKVYEFLYSDSVLELERKKKKFRDLIGFDEENPTAQVVEDIAA